LTSRRAAFVRQDDPAARGIPERTPEGAACIANEMGTAS
jgi:hypothetical protein